MLFDNNNVDLDFTFLNLSNITSNDRKYLKAKEGFLKGNMFPNEYKPYKNLTYLDLVPKTDREASLFNVMQYSFAINDMNLYLDLHPNDLEALKYLEELSKEEKNAKDDFESKYGPLEVCNTIGDSFKWINDPWPWENTGGAKYV